MSEHAIGQQHDRQVNEKGGQFEWLSKVMLGFTRYSLYDQMDWDTQLARKNGRVNACGLFDTEQKSRPVAAAYRKLIEEFSNITALAHGEMFELTERDAVTRLEI